MNRWFRACLMTACLVLVLLFLLGPIRQISVVTGQGADPRKPKPTSKKNSGAKSDNTTATKPPPPPASTKTPTLAYKALYEAVKKKDSEGIKKVMSKGMLEMWAALAAQQKKTLNKVIENGGTETTFASRLPPTRNEKIWGNVAIPEVENEKTGSWDALPFVKEEGNWKLAIDTYFSGTMTPSGPANLENPGQLPPSAQPRVP